MGRLKISTKTICNFASSCSLIMEPLLSAPRSKCKRNIERPTTGRCTHNFFIIPYYYPNWCRRCHRRWWIIDSEEANQIYFDKCRLGWLFTRKPCFGVSDLPRSLNSVEPLISALDDYTPVPSLMANGSKLSATKVSLFINICFGFRIH